MRRKRQKRVYVAVPLTHGRKRTRAQNICRFLRKEGLRVTSHWVAEKDAKQGLNKQAVYDRDVLAVAESDAVVAEVSEPSLGIGMELMVALTTGTPTAVLYEEGRSVSWMVLGAPGVHSVPYCSECIDESLENVAAWLHRLPLMSNPKRLFLNTNKEEPYV
jgi:hypothetical protein